MESIRGYTAGWIRSFLTYRTQKVSIDPELSTPKDVISGVPQGTVLGPTLFLSYIYDIPDCIKDGSSIKLFADDALMY